MKFFVLVFLSIFVSKGCGGQPKNDIQTAIIEYTANTRGFYQKISLQNQIVSITKDRTGSEKPLSRKVSEDDWNEVVGCFKTIQLDSLATLKPPSKKRLFDGAAIANLKISYKDKSYQTTSFDHGYPPEVIKKLVDKINSFAKKE
jgi:hypothetical protein